MKLYYSHEEKYEFPSFMWKFHDHWFLFLRGINIDKNGEPSPVYDKLFATYKDDKNWRIIETLFFVILFRFPKLIFVSSKTQTMHTELSGY